MGNSNDSNFTSNANTAEQFCKIVLAGLDQSGKTAFLYKYKTNIFFTPLQTIGTYNEIVRPSHAKDLKFNIYDLSGEKNKRVVWCTFFNDCDALIYMIDANDRARFHESITEFRNILKDRKMHGIPILILANKQDLAGDSMIQPEEIIEKFGLESIKELLGNPFYVQGMSVRTGKGVNEAMKKLVDLIREKKAPIQKK
jgi:small GTP-binding protein